MEFNKYQILTRRTAPDLDSFKAVDNCIYGLNGETGELTDLLKKWKFQGHNLSIPEIEKEIGDILWYLARLADEFDLKLEDIAIKNIDKLKRRYPEGFSENRSINRND